MLSNNRLCRVFLIIFLLAGLANYSQAQDLEGYYSKIFIASQRDIDSQSKSNELNFLYNKFIREKQRHLEDWSSPDIKTLFRSANILSFYTGRPEYADDMRKDLTALEGRREAEGSQYHAMYGTYVEARNFSAAQKLLAAHPSISAEALPLIIHLSTFRSGPAILYQDLTNQNLYQSAVDLTKAQVIVVAHPFCHFTRNAIKDIESDVKISRLFTAHSTWITPPARQLDLGPIRNWNKQHVAAPMVLAYDRESWDMIDSWETPTFYFIKDGRLKAKVVGWPQSGNMQAIKKAFHTIGLEPGEEPGQIDGVDETAAPDR